MSNGLMQSARQLAPSPHSREWSPEETLALSYIGGADRATKILRRKVSPGSLLANVRIERAKPSFMCDFDAWITGNSGERLVDDWRERQWKRQDAELKRRLEAAKKWLPDSREVPIPDFNKHLIPGREREAEKAREWHAAEWERLRATEPPSFAWSEERGLWVAGNDGSEFSGREVKMPVYLALDAERIEELTTRNVAGCVLIFRDDLDDDTALHFDAEHALRVQLGEGFERLVLQHTRRAPKPLVV